MAGGNGNGGIGGSDNFPNRDGGNPVGAGGGGGRGVAGGGGAAAGGGGPPGDGAAGGPGAGGGGGGFANWNTGPIVLGAPQQGGAGGAGGSGVAGSAGPIVGMGGQGPGGNGGGGGGGGEGGLGFYDDGGGAAAAVVVNTSISGGVGGAGGAGGAGGNGTPFGAPGDGGGGGDGGVGLIATNGAVVTINAGRTVSGGTGGVGGAVPAATGPGQLGGAGGKGGLGVYNNGGLLTNNGTITGGNGAAGGAGFAGATGAGGVGGAGVISSGNITNGGTISGGFNAAGGRADAIRFLNSATLNLSNGVAAGEIAGAISIAGTLTLQNNGVATISLGSVLKGAGAGIQKAGAGLLILSGTSTYTGNTSIIEGTLRVNGSIAASSGTSVGINAVLEGTGTVGTLFVFGALSPGTSPGVLNSGNLNLGGNFNVELGGTGLGDYDRVNVSGTVALGGNLNLSLFGGYVPTLGASFTIISNDDADAVVGTFAGLAQGGTVLLGGYIFTVNYAGGDGNDVVLTVTGQPGAGTGNQSGTSGGQVASPPATAATILGSQLSYILRYSSQANLPETITTPSGQVLPNPLLEQQKAVQALAAQVDAGTLSLQAALDRIVDLADATTAVPVMTYQFFTGKVPTQEGLDWLVSSGVNGTDLNDGYYAGISLENRYINFAVNLGKVGEGRAAFTAGYGALSLSDATAKAYAEIFGKAPDAAKLSAILTPERSSYFLSMGGDALGQKAAMVGWLLGEAAKADTGPYSVMTENFLYDLNDGVAAFGADAHIYLGAGPKTVALVGTAEG